MSDLARIGYNHIDKLDFLADYPQAYIEAFQPETIRNSFTATGLTPINPERMLSKLNISLRTPTPPESRQAADLANSHLKHPKLLLSYSSKLLY